MVLYKQSSRPDHDCIFQFTVSSRRKCSIVSTWQRRDSFFTTTCRQAQWTRLSLSQVQLCSKATELDLRISRQPEELHIRHEEEATVLLISSLTKQVLNSSNTSTMINDLINNCAQDNSARVDYDPVSHNDSGRAGLLQRPIQGRATQSRERQRHRKDRRTHRIQTTCEVDKGKRDQSLSRSR